MTSQYILDQSWKREHDRLEVRVVYGPLLVSAWGQTTER
jgi:hypothetical protein